MAGIASPTPTAPRAKCIAPRSSRRATRALSARPYATLHSSSSRDPCTKVLASRNAATSAATFPRGAGKSTATPARLDSILTSPDLRRAFIVARHVEPPLIDASNGSFIHARRPGMVKLPLALTLMTPSPRLAPERVNAPPNASPRKPRNVNPDSENASTPFTRPSIGRSSSSFRSLLANWNCPVSRVFEASSMGIDIRRLSLPTPDACIPSVYPSIMRSTGL